MTFENPEKGARNSFRLNPGYAASPSSNEITLSISGGKPSGLRFTAEANRVYRITTLALQGRADTMLSLFDQDGTTRLMDDNDSGPEARADQITFTAPTSGTYYVLVQPADPSQFGAYTGYSVAVFQDAKPPVVSAMVPVDGAQLTTVTPSLSATLRDDADSEDTGLEVDALAGAPGVRSARYAGEDATYADNVNKLIDALRDVPTERRTARFRCVCLARFPDGRECKGEGVLEGTVVDTPQGEHGFGYDPIFVAEGHAQTFGEMDPAQKHAMSHRADAFSQLVAACFEDA